MATIGLDDIGTSTTLESNKSLSAIVYTRGMLSYTKLKARPRDFLAATGLTLDEFQQLLPAFQGAYEKRYLYELTRAGKPRQRRPGGGAKGVLQSFADKL